MRHSLWHVKISLRVPWAYCCIFALKVVIAVCGTTCVFASTTDHPQIKMLATDRIWLRLLHLTTLQTRIISPGFYLSASAHKPIDLVAELQANLKAALSTPLYRCKFPARDEWLRRHFPELNHVPRVSCPELEKWQMAQSIHSISVVYPNHSMASPLSVFSHTFLKFNSAQLPLGSNLHLALGFAAEIDSHDSLAKLIAMGFFGGYVGRFSMSNYYTEVNRYGEVESRDIFEYELNLSQNEIRFLLLHLWEIQEADFHYYFLNGNCSYHLLTLLEVVRTDLDLSSHFHMVTIPLESVKVMFQQQHLIRSQRWLPGKKSRQESFFKQLSEPARAFYRQLRRENNVGGLAIEFQETSFSAQEKAIVLDLLAESTRGESEFVDLRNEALKLRSQLPVETDSAQDISPQEWPHNSHGAQAMSLGAGYNQNQQLGWAQLRYRLAFHHFMDPPQGYFQNVIFEVADLRLRYSPEKEWADSSLTVFHTLVLKPWSESDQGISWQVRSQILDLLQEVRWQNHGGLGIAAKWGASHLYTMAVIDSYLDRNEKGKFGILSGITIGLAFNLHEKLKIRGNLDHVWPLQSNYEKSLWQGEAQAAFAFSTDWSLQWSLASSWRQQSTLVELLNYF